MNKTRLLARVAVLTMLGGVLAQEALAGSQWWTENWIYRRSVTVHEFTPTKLAGDDIAVIEFYTGGLTLPGGTDIRVVTPDGKEMPSRVLMSGPGDAVVVAFAITSAGNRFFVYYGNPKPPATKELDIQRGVLQEAWGYADGGIKTLEQVQKLVLGQKDFIGRGFRDRIFQGHNPFGPQNRISTVYTGYFVAPEKGGYVFACSSQDASFLLIDDKEVVDNGGHHRPQGDVSRQGKVDLEAGLHKLTLYHVSTQGDPTAVAAWKSPSALAIKPMPPDAFAPVAKASVGPLERYGKDVEIEVNPVHAGECFVAERYLQRYSFEAMATGSARDIQWQWDFGDGQKSTAARVEHVYLTPGEYKVTLTGKTFAGTMTRVNRVFVSRPWDWVTDNKLDTMTQHARIVADYDFTALPTDGLCQAMVLLSRAAQPKPLLSAGAALLAKEQCPPRPLAEAMELYAEALVAAGQADKAVVGLAKSARMTSDPAVCAGLLTQAGQIAVQSGDAAKAQEAFEIVLKQYGRLTTSPSIRQAQIGLGDSWRLRGDYEKASQAYAAAKVQLDAALGQAAIAKGDFARHVEDYIRQKNLESAREYLERWEQAIPADRLEGYLSLMRCRYFVARNQFADATTEAEILVKVNPASNYAPQLLMLAADAWQKQGKADRSQACLQLLVDKYKESPLSAEAAKKLK